MRYLGVTLVYEPWGADIQPGLRMLCLGDLKANLIIRRKKNMEDATSITWLLQYTQPYNPKQKLVQRKKPLAVRNRNEGWT